ncbi:MAG: aminotransferase class IV [Myxococcota bacterium]
MPPSAPTSTSTTADPRLDLPHWWEGRLQSLAAPPAPAVAPRTGCYTTARVVAGAPRWLDRHLRRLRRDARRLGLDPPPEAECRRALVELAGAAFPSGEGVVRLELRPQARGSGCLVGTARPLGPEADTWSAVLSKLPHPGVRAGAGSGAKLSGREFLEGARELARSSGVDEALLLDGRGFLVEGARTNLVVAGEAGEPSTPPLARGGVAGLAREVIVAGMPELREADVDRAGLGRARELIALNAVRGARPITRLDGRPVGDGRPGPLARRLAAILAASG